ncbi:hypothetical protein [Streptomyces sp. NPDC046939]|uniref:hypothetical protein n=1 Tax=Streptomyces sp. NPDC046939 TaxID=3155376 RepID=UPI0033F91822
MAEGQRDAFRRAVQHFDPAYRIPLRISGAVWTGAYARYAWLKVRLVAGLAGFATLALLINPPSIFADEAWKGNEGWSQVGGLVSWSLNMSMPAPSPSAVLWWISASVCLWFMAASLRRSESLSRLRGSYRLMHVNRVPYACSVAIRHCSQLSKRTPYQTQTELAAVEMSVSLLIHELRRVPHDRSWLQRRSARRTAIRHHVNLVAAALQKQTLRLDSDPSGAAREIASMALTICNAYVLQQHGRFLSEAQLAGLEPARNREVLRIAAAGVITFSVSYLGAVVGVPGTVLPLLFGLVGVIAFNTIVGRTSRSLELLDSVRGLQRP